MVSLTHAMYRRVQVNSPQLVIKTMSLKVALSILLTVLVRPDLGSVAALQEAYNTEFFLLLPKGSRKKLRNKHCGHSTGAWRRITRSMTNAK